MSYARAGNWVGCVKSTVGKWLAKAPLAVPELPPDGTLELDGLWTRTRTGRTELKVIRDAAAGTALGAFGSWAEVIDRAWQQGAQHLVSDGDGAIAAGIEAGLWRGCAAPVVRVSPVAGVPEEHWDGGICGGAAAVGREEYSGGSGMGKANYAGDGWGGALLVRESVVQRTASLGDGAGEASDDVAIGAAQS